MQHSMSDFAKKNQKRLCEPGGNQLAKFHRLKKIFT
jgi:hypothetical protein